MTPLEALQKALAGEHAAMYVFGVLGAQASGSRQPALFRELDSTYAIHRAARDELTVLVSAKGADPVAAEVSYDPPGRFGNASQIRGTALVVEQRLTQVYAELVANTSGKDRSWAIGALDSSALRELDFGGVPTDFPGLG